MLFIYALSQSTFASPPSFTFHIQTETTGLYALFWKEVHFKITNSSIQIIHDKFHNYICQDMYHT